MTWIEFLVYRVLVLSGNIWTIKLGILRCYSVRTFFALLFRGLIITRSPCLHIAINSCLVRNGGSTCNLNRSLLNPSDTFRGVQNIFFSRSAATLAGNR